jgi:hypothetical protein
MFVLAPLDLGTRAPEGGPAGRPGRHRPRRCRYLEIIEELEPRASGGRSTAFAGVPEARRRALIIQAAGSLLEPRRLPESWSRTVFFRPSHNSPRYPGPRLKKPAFADHQSVTPPERRSHPVTPVAGNAADRARQLPRGRRRWAAAPSKRRGETRACGGGRSWSRSALASPGRYTLPAAIIGTV